MFPYSQQLHISFLLLLLSLPSDMPALLSVQVPAQPEFYPRRNHPMGSQVPVSSPTNERRHSQPSGGTNKGSGKKAEPPIEPPTIQEVYDRYYANKQYAEAVAGFEKIVKANAGDTEAQLFLGKSYYLLGNEAQKKKDYRMAQENYKNAVEAFKAVLRVHPNDAEAQLNLGKAYYNLAKWDNARVEYEKAVKLLPEDGEPQFALGKTYFWLEDYQHAIDWCELASKLGYTVTLPSKVL